MANKDISNGFRKLTGGNIDALNTVYATVALACEAIPNVLDGDGVNLRFGKIVQIGTLTDHKEHKWIGGFEDHHLIEVFADARDFKKIDLIIKTDANGNINFVDQNQNIGFQFTANGTFRVFNVDAKSLSLGGEPLVIDDLAKQVPFNDLKLIVDVLNSSIDITDDGSFRLVDPNGFIGLKFLNGVFETHHVKAKRIGTGMSFFESDSDHIFTIKDDTELKNMAMYLDKQGEFGVKSIKTQNLNVTGNVTFPPGVIKGVSSRRSFCYGDQGDYILISSFGQSNARGEGGGGNITTDQLGLLMPNAGLDSEPASNYSDFVPYIASTETPIPGIVAMFKNLIESRAKINWSKKDFNIVASLPALGGATIQQISKGTAPYAKLIGHITGCLNIAKSKGKTLTVPFLPFTQGESNSTTTYATYLALLIQLIEDLNVDVRALNPDQRNIIPFIGYQMNGNWYNESDGVSKVHADLGINDPRYICACPSYFFEYAREGANKDIVIHFTPAFRRIYGAYLNIAAYSLLYENRKFLPLHPIKLTVIGNNLQVKYYVPKGFLVLDTATVPDPGNYGFRIVKNNNDLVLSNIKVLPDGETLSIDCSESPAGALFLYARNKLAPVYNIDADKAMFGARGCLRDTQGDTLKIDNYPLHNWAIASFLNIN